MAKEMDFSWPAEPDGSIRVQYKLDSLTPAVFDNDEAHDMTLKYLESRLQQGRTKRPGRLQRYARVDKLVSTWQRLTDADSQRKAKQELTGEAQALNINLPLITTHLEDVVSFYANIYSPASGQFFQLPLDAKDAEPVKALVTKLNSDAEATKSFKWLTRMLRSLFKYNIGGVMLWWGDKDGIGLDPSESGGMNWMEAIDVYNFMWDPTVHDPAKIPTEAEWAATIKQVNRKTLLDMEIKGVYAGVKDILHENEESNSNAAQYYRYPPFQAGVTAEDEVTQEGNTVNWAAYGAALGSDEAAPILGHERVEIYCWVNPQQLGLNGAKQQAWELWRFHIIDMKRIVYAKKVEFKKGDQAELELRPEIPYYCGYEKQDEMGYAQRSTAELMSPFQSFASFLMNAHISQARGSIWGIQAYDETMFDMSQLPPGTTAGRVPSKMPGRDVRSGLLDIKGNMNNENTMQNLMTVMQLMQQLFPAQAMPAQVAGIDRAVQSQVAAVMQGMSRRLHMTVRILDDDIMGPFTHASYRNIALNSDVGITGLTDADARLILGSGVQQLNIEQAEAAYRELFFAILQNPQLVQENEIDIFAMIQYWSVLKTLRVPVDSFKKQQSAAQSAQPGGTPNAPGSAAQAGTAPIPA